MQWIPCSVAQWISIECSGLRAVWWSGFWLIAVNSLQRGPLDLDWMQWIPCSVFECSVFHAAWRNGTLLNAVDFMKHDRMQWIPCSMIECSGFYAAWPKASRLNAVDSMYCDWMQSTPCSLVKWIPIECSGFHAVWLNAVNDIQLSKMNPD